MKRSRSSEEQIIDALKPVENGRGIPEIVRELGIAETTFDRWRRKYGGMESGGSPCSGGPRPRRTSCLSTCWDRMVELEPSGQAVLIQRNPVASNAGVGMRMASDTPYRENVIRNSPAVSPGLNMRSNSCDGTTTCP